MRAKIDVYREIQWMMTEFSIKDERALRLVIKRWGIQRGYIVDKNEKQRKIRFSEVEENEFQAEENELRYIDLIKIRIDSEDGLTHAYLEIYQASMHH